VAFLYQTLCVPPGPVPAGDFARLSLCAGHRHRFFSFGHPPSKTFGYRIDHHLPIVTTLVVRKSRHRLNPSAIQNIYAECKEFRLDLGMLDR
jgi:hypothetical protein